MRKLVFHIQTTLDNRISHATGDLWEPFPWGPPETAYLTSLFRESDTWVLGRKLYEIIVPWWDAVATDGKPPDGSTVTAADLEFDAGCLLARYRVAQKGGEVGGAARDLRGSHELGPLR